MTSAHEVAHNPEVIRSFGIREHETQPRITVAHSGKALQYYEVAALTVADLARADITLFGHALVIGYFISGYRATWSPSCQEVPRTFAAEERASECVRACYETALARGGFECKEGVSGFSRGSGDAATHFLREQSSRH